MRTLNSLPLAASLVVFCGALAAAETVEVTAAALNLRTGPSTANSVIGSAPRGARMTLLSRTGNWAQVSYNGRTAYAYASYLRTVPGTSTPSSVTRYVTATSLNVRSAASANSSVRGVLSRGQAVEVTGGSGEWARINFNGSTAYAYGSYLSANRPSTAPTGVTRYVTSSTLNVRSGAGTRYRALGLLSQGQAVTVLGSSGDWSRISFNGATAYAHSGYLSANRPSTGGGSTGSGSNGYASSPNRSRAGFIQLANSGPGFFGYYVSSKRWGRSTLVYGIERAARRFKAANPSAPRLGVGDISLVNGGDISGHASHERGVDADFRPMRNNGTEGPVTITQSAYSRTLTQRILDLLRSEMRVRTIFFNDSRVRGVQNWPNHANHFHVRIY